MDPVVQEFRKLNDEQLELSRLIIDAEVGLLSATEIEDEAHFQFDAGDLKAEYNDVYKRFQNLWNKLEAEGVFPLEYLQNVGADQAPHSEPLLDLAKHVRDVSFGQPPELWAFALRFLPTSRTNRDCIRGDMLEQFDEIQCEHGHRWAVGWFIYMTVASFVSIIWGKIPSIITFAKWVK